MLVAYKNYDYAGVLHNETLYPQDIRNCTKCHDGSTTSRDDRQDGNNWKNAPSRLACGACHDGINFATGKGVTLTDAAKGLTVSAPSRPRRRPAARRLRSARCATADTARPGIDIDSVHLPVTPPNPEQRARRRRRQRQHELGLDRLGPRAGCRPARSWSPTTSRASRATRSKQPVMVFRLLQNGAPTPSTTSHRRGQSGDGTEGDLGQLHGLAERAVRVRGAAGRHQRPRPTSTPRRRGYLRKIWNGTATGTGAGTLTGPDADGFYTVTLTGVTIPDNAVMLTGGMGYSYNATSTQPLTQTNLADYPVTPDGDRAAPGRRTSRAA